MKDIFFWAMVFFVIGLLLGSEACEYSIRANTISVIKEIELNDNGTAKYYFYIGNATDNKKFYFVSTPDEYNIGDTIRVIGQKYLQ